MVATCHHHAGSYLWNGRDSPSTSVGPQYVCYPQTRWAGLCLGMCFDASHSLYQSAYCRKPRIWGYQCGYQCNCFPLKYLQWISIEMIFQSTLETHSFQSPPQLVQCMQNRVPRFTYVQSRNMLDGRSKLGRNNQCASSSGAGLFSNSCSWWKDKFWLHVHPQSGIF